MKTLFRYAAILALCILIPSGQAKRAPNFELKDTSGKPHKIAELRGSVAVVNFWATWCGPCREELPMLSRVAADYSAKGVHFVAISADEAKNKPQLDRFLATNTVGMDVWTGASVYMLDRADLGQELPATMILDADGEVVTRMLGEAREPEVRAAIDWLLGGKTGPAPAPVYKHY